MISINFDNVEKLLKDVQTRTGDSTSFDIDIWHYKGDKEPHAPEFKLWVTKYNRHFYGPTLDVIENHLEAYEAGYEAGLKAQSNPS